MRKPVAFNTINSIHSFWNDSGPYFNKSLEDLYVAIPAQGPVTDKDRPALEIFRVACNCYYDLYNNNLCNRAKEFRKVFGFSGFTATAQQIEDRMTEIIKAALDERDRADSCKCPKRL